MTTTTTPVGAVIRTAAADGWRLRAAFTVSSLGDWVYRFVLPTSVLLTTGSAQATALAYVLELVPYVGVGLVAGVVADRFDRRRVLVACDLTSTVVELALVAVLLLPDPPLWALYAVALVLACVRPFSFPAFQGLVSEVVAPSRLSRFNAWTQSVDSTLGLVGPALGTAVIGLAGVPTATGLDALTFLASAALVASVAHRRVRPHPTLRGAGPPRAVLRGLGRDLRGGLRALLAVRTVRAGTVVMAGANLAGFVVEPNLVFLVLHVQARPPVVLGLVFAAQGAGALVGAILAPRLVDRWGTVRLLQAGMALSALALAVPVVVPTVVAVGAGLAVEGAATSLVVVAWFTLRQDVVPADVLGRVVAAGRALAYATIPLGAVVGGLLVVTAEPGRALFATACAIQVVVAVLTFRHVRPEQTRGAVDVPETHT